MAYDNNIVSFKAVEKPVKLDDKARQSVDDCRHVAERALPTLMNGLFEKLDDALYELADKSESNQLQTVYFNAMRTVRMHRSAIHDHFVSGVVEDFDAFWNQGPRDTAVQSNGTEDDFSLVDNEELEENLAVNNLVSKGESRYQRELFQLNRAFGYLVGAAELDSGRNPLGPAGICNRFRESLVSLETDTPVRLVIYKLFDRHVMNYLGGLYEEINALLGRAGILPKIQHPVHRSPGGQPSRAAPPAHAPAGTPDVGGQAQPAGAYYGQASGGNHPAGEDIQEGLFNTLQQLLGGYRGAAGYAPPVVDRGSGLPVVETPELLGVLSQLQHASVGYFRHGDGAVPSRVDLRDRLADELDLKKDGEDSRALGQADEDTLDVISMLFDFLLESHNLPDAIKALISRLQIPVLKVAILDKSFFSRKLHPARRLLNSLARSAVGWSDDGDRSENSLYGRIESIVNQVVSGYGEDSSLFDKLNDEFTAWLEREQRGAEIAEERTKQVTQGKEQLRVAKQVVSDEVHARLRRHPMVPLVVRELIEEGWKDVLLLNYLRQGPESDAWIRNLELADRLLWSVEPKAEYAQRQELLRAIPELLRSLREGLNGISYDQHKMARMLKELQTCHISCLRGAQVAAAPAGMPKTERVASRAPVDPSPVAVETADVVEPIQHDRFTELAESISVGDWMELIEEDGRRVRIKLSWKSDVSDAYVFVNRKGVKVLEMTLAGVAKLIRDGGAEVLSDMESPILDLAFNATMETLKKSQAG